MNEREHDLPLRLGLRHLAAFLVWALLAFHNLPLHALLDGREAQHVEMRDADFVIAAGRSELPYRMGDVGKVPPPRRPVATEIRSPVMVLALCFSFPRDDAASAHAEFQRPPVRGPPTA